MYTNIPINDTINIITNTLKSNNEDTYLRQLTNSLKIILKQKYFQYNKLYHQKDGLSMGAPTSAIISEIMLQKLDEEINNKYNKTERPIRKLL